MFYLTSHVHNEGILFREEGTDAKHLITPNTEGRKNKKNYKTGPQTSDSLDPRQGTKVKYTQTQAEQKDCLCLWTIPAAQSTKYIGDKFEEPRSTNEDYFPLSSFMLRARTRTHTHTHVRARAHTHTHTHTHRVLMIIFPSPPLSHTHTTTHTHTHTHNSIRKERKKGRRRG